ELRYSIAERKFTRTFSLTFSVLFSVIRLVKVFCAFMKPDHTHTNTHTHPDTKLFHLDQCQ
ncbi:hypothetical protein ANANG_G00147530, partial [Anguilla anguilla]